MAELRLSFNTRKALCVQIGESAGRELADLLIELSRRIDELERTKVSVTAIAPSESENLMHVIAPRRAA